MAEPTKPNQFELGHFRGQCVKTAGGVFALFDSSERAVRAAARTRGPPGPDRPARALEAPASRPRSPRVGGSPSVGGSPLGSEHDAGDEHGAQRVARGVGRERQRHARREQERADRRARELVEQQEGALEPRVGEAEVPALNESRQHARLAHVREHLGRAEHEQAREHDRDRHRVRGDGGREDGQHERPPRVRERDDPPPVEAVGQAARGAPTAPGRCRCAA